MSCVRSLLVLCCVAQLSQAQSLVVLSEDLKSAWYAPSKSSAAIPVDRVVRLSGDGPGGPPPPLPPPSPDSPLTKLSATWSIKVADYPKRDQHRQALSGMYLVLSEQVQAGSFQNIDQLETITKQMQAMLLGADRSKWDAWGRDVGAYLGANVSSLAAARQAYLEIAAGLDKTEALSPELLELLILIIKLLLARLFPGS